MERESDAGVCMFNYECYKQKGTVLGTCIDGFLFGACCRLPTPDDIVSSTSAATTTTEVVVVVDNFIVSSSSSRPAESEDGLTNYIKFGPLKTNVGPEGTSQDGPQQQAESSSELAVGSSTVYLGEQSQKLLSDDIFKTFKETM